MSTLIFKIEKADKWRSATLAGVYTGAAVDHDDGFIHFSAADQVAGTLAKHFSGQQGLVLIAVDAEALDEALKWEVSRGGALFPHLYATLDPTAVAEVRPIPDSHDLAGFSDWGIAP